MRNTYILLITAFLWCSIYSCKKDGQKSSSIGNRSMLIGKWTLNKQKSVQYIDGIMQTDTLYLPADTNYSQVQFSDNNKYTSVSYFDTSNSLIKVVSVDSAKGTFSLSGTKFSLSAGLTGLGEHSFFASSGPLPVISLVSKTEQISELNSGSLTLHTELVTTQTISASTKTYKTVNDLYYTR